MTLQARIKWIETLPRFQPKVDLNHLKEVVIKLDLKSDAKKIHVTGTNGKGSVVSLLTNMLKHQYNVGTFMSPYLYQFNERILINGTPINDQLLEEGLIWAHHVHETFGPFSFFETLTLMAFHLFKLLKLDVWVIEVGIGGRLDSTNILNYDASVITNIGADHLNILGPTLNDVCREKLGIVKENNVLFTTIQSDFYEQVTEHVSDMHAQVHFIQEQDVHILSTSPISFEFHEKTYVMKMKGIHQAYNASLAILVIKEVFPNIKEETIHVGLLETQVMGRFQEILPNVILDAAHNAHAIKALNLMLERYYPKTPIFILMSVLGDKDIHSMIHILKKENRHIILTSFEDMRYKDISIYKDDDIIFIESAYQAYEHIQTVKTNDAILIMTGSIHFIGYMGKYLLSK
jgi:dihydrofolate synthase / folylpolyglutamate synthase